ncbi:MAG TPA: acetolactate decarboxylase [Kiritimatiellia bacterium]|nr:acetolactate decarboxylase [Kiritimatiellia bacterium]
MTVRLFQCPPVAALTGCLLIAFGNGCRTSTTTLVQDRDTLTQLAPFLYVLSGNYDGLLTVSDFKSAGSFGIGTFDGLDGEAVLLDGIVYQVKGDGTVHVPDDTVGMPFGACTLFDADRQHVMRHVSSFTAFTQALETLFEDRHIFYAVRVHGDFKSMRVRSCDRQGKPYRPLAEATRDQHEYTYTNTRGTLVGFWTPPFVPGSIGVPGFHFHYLADDRTHGGHVLDFESEKLTVVIDPTPRITINFTTPGGVPLVEHDIERQVHDAERSRR